jgi:hypothetical protein
VRLSVSGNPAIGDAAWTCVAEWRAREEQRPDTTFFFAADRAASAALDRDLRAFAAEDAEHLTMLTFADSMTRPCPGPR